MDLREKTSLEQGKSQHLHSAVLWIVLILVVVLSTCALALSIYTSIAKTNHDNQLEEANIQLERLATTIDNMSSLLLYISNTTKKHEECIADLETVTSTILALNSLQTLFQELNDTVKNQLPQELDEIMTSKHGTESGFCCSAEPISRAQRFSSKIFVESFQPVSASE